MILCILGVVLRWDTIEHSYGFKMPSVRVRRNTAPVAALVPAERLRNQSTSSRGSTGENAAARHDQVSEGGTDDKKRSLDKEEAVVVLAPPVSVTASSAGMKGECHNHKGQPLTLT